MAITLTNIYNRVVNILRDDSSTLGDAVIKDLIKDSVALVYDKDRPYMKKKEYTGTGAAFEFAMPTDWVEGFSMITTVEYPSGEQRQEYMPDEDWELTLQTDGTRKIRFLEDTPSTSEKFLVE